MPGPGRGAPAGGVAETEPEPDVLAVIEGAAESVRSIGDAPLDEHAERYKALHSTLQGALSDTDLRDSG
jgi:hypothetical protein